jgi:hypothetical protein
MPAAASRATSIGTWKSSTGMLRWTTSSIATSVFAIGARVVSASSASRRDAASRVKGSPAGESAVKLRPSASPVISTTGVTVRLEPPPTPPTSV